MGSVPVSFLREFALLQNTAISSRAPDTDLIRQSIKRAEGLEGGEETYRAGVPGLLKKSGSELFRQEIWRDWSEDHLEVPEDDLEERKRELVQMATGRESTGGVDIVPLDSASEYRRLADSNGEELEELLSSEINGTEAVDALEKIVEFYLERTDELDRVEGVSDGGLVLRDGPLRIEDSYFAFVRNGKKQVRDVIFDEEVRDEHLIHGSLLLNLQEEANQVRFDMPFSSNGDEPKYYINPEMVLEEEPVLSSEQVERLKCSASSALDDFRSELDDELAGMTGLRREGIEMNRYLDKISRMEPDGEELVDLAVNRALDQTVLQHSAENILRGQTEDGRRVYFDGNNYFYSVTTIKERIDSGFGDNEASWDPKDILDYTGARGTWAHFEALKHLTDGLEGPEEHYAREQLREFGRKSDYDGKHPMKSLLEWKQASPEDLYLTESDTTGYDIARGEVDWVEKKFLELMNELGITEDGELNDNIYEVEKKFTVETGRVELAGQFDVVYEDLRTGEKVLLDLKTSKRLYDGHKIQTNAYRRAVDQLEEFDFEIDRVVIPAISPELGEAKIYSDKEHPEADYITEEFYDCSVQGIEDDWFEWNQDEWSRNYYQDEMWEIFARAQSTLPEPDPRNLDLKPY